jgi:hypothetical protein
MRRLLFRGLQGVPAEGLRAAIHAEAEEMEKMKMKGEVIRGEEGTQMMGTYSQQTLPPDNRSAAAARASSLSQKIHSSMTENSEH